MDWYLHADFGNDANDGKTEDTPWLTLAHTKAVLEGLVLKFSQTLHIAGANQFLEPININVGGLHILGHSCGNPYPQISGDGVNPSVLYSYQSMENISLYSAPSIPFQSTGKMINCMINAPIQYGISINRCFLPQVSNTPCIDTLGRVEGCVSKTMFQAGIGRQCVKFTRTYAPSRIVFIGCVFFYQSYPFESVDGQDGIFLRCGWVEGDPYTPSTWVVRDQPLTNPYDPDWVAKSPDPSPMSSEEISAMVYGGIQNDYVNIADLGNQAFLNLMFRSFKGDIGMLKTDINNLLMKGNF